MLIDTHFLQYCAEKAREVGEHYSLYCLNGKAFPRSVGDLADIVGQYCEKKLLFREVPISSKNNIVRGFYIRRGDEFHIYTLEGIPEPYLRFIQCKETFHALLENELFVTGDLVELIQNMMLRASPESADLNLGHQTTAETLAEIAAAEFLFPYSGRKADKTRLSNGFDIANLADHYGVPTFVISRYLTDGMIKVLEPFFETRVCTQ
jgi:hypothetical protein